MSKVLLALLDTHLVAFTRKPMSRYPDFLNCSVLSAVFISCQFLSLASLSCSGSFLARGTIKVVICWGINLNSNFKSWLPLRFDSIRWAINTICFFQWLLHIYVLWPCRYGMLSRSLGHPLSLTALVREAKHFSETEAEIKPTTWPEECHFKMFASWGWRHEMQMTWKKLLHMFIIDARTYPCLSVFVKMPVQSLPLAFPQTLVIRGVTSCSAWKRGPWIPAFMLLTCSALISNHCFCER